MREQLNGAEALRDGLFLVASGLGLMLEPPVLVACILLSVVGAVVGRGFSPAMAAPRAYILTLAGGVIFGIGLLLVDQSLHQSVDWWPVLPPQLIAIIAGFIGPLALPLILRRFPMLADRLIDRYLPDGSEGEK
ncbi:MAG: hypothetical protein ABJL99_10180 [Aliishimia sp.]